MDPKDKVSIVTGSSRGIGRAIAERLAENGSLVVVNSASSKLEGQRMATELRKKGFEAAYLQADVSEREQAERLFEETKKLYGSVDILVNNAGIFLEGRAKDNDMGRDLGFEEYMRVHSVNGWAVYLCSLLAGKYMGKKGKIVNISSVYAEDPSIQSPVASGAKAEVNAYTKAFAKKYLKRIDVNSVAPGYTDTKLLRENVSEEALKGVIASTGLGRLVSPYEIADAVVSVIMNDAMTGKVIAVDAGYSI